MRLDGYVRDLPVGMGGASLLGESIPAERQRRAIESYAEELGGQVCFWHHDAAVLLDGEGRALRDGIRTVSAANWSLVARGHATDGGATTPGCQARPGLRNALARLGAGETDGIVVMSLDRAASTAVQLDAIFRGIVDAGRTFASCIEHLDPLTAPGSYARLLMQMPPPHPRDVRLGQADRGRWAPRGPRSDEEVDRAPAPPRRESTLWRRFIAVVLMPLAAVGINRQLEGSQPPPAVIQEVEISLPGGSSSGPPPGSDQEVVASLLQGLDKPGGVVRKPMTIDAHLGLAKARKVYGVWVRKSEKRDR